MTIQDMKLPANHIGKGDLILSNGKWWRVRSVRATRQYGEGEPFPEEICIVFEFELEDIEGQIVHLQPESEGHIFRVRPVSPDPWQGRRKEGRFD